MEVNKLFKDNNLVFSNKKKEDPIETTDFTFEDLIGVSYDFLPIHFLMEGVEIQKSVARIIVEYTDSDNKIGIQYGTGFMISDDLLLTNYHLLPSKPFPIKNTNKSINKVNKCKVQFNYQTDWKGIEAKDEIFECNFNYYVSDSELDYAIIKVINSPGKKYGKINLDYTIKGIPNKPVIIIQHPEKKMKEIVLNNNNIRKVHTHYILYETDTLSGSSGSPVFNESWDLVALHSGTNNIEFLNQGTNVESILKNILQKKFSSLSIDMQNYLKKALDNSYLPTDLLHFSGLQYNSTSSYFKIEGLMDNDKIIKDKSSFLDLAYWHIAFPPFGTKVEINDYLRIADYINYLKMDVWNLKEISPSVLEIIKVVSKEQYNKLFESLGNDVGSSHMNCILYDKEKFDCKKIKLDNIFDEWSEENIKPLFMNITLKNHNEKKFNFDILFFDLILPINERNRNIRVNEIKILSKWIDKIKTKRKKYNLILIGNWNKSNDKMLLDQFSTINLFLHGYDNKEGSIIGLGINSDKYKLILPKSIQYQNFSGSIKKINKKIPKYSPPFGQIYSASVPTIMRIIL